MKQRNHVSGSVSVEFALVVIVALPLILGIFETGRALGARHGLSYLADQGARLVRIMSPDPDFSLLDLQASLEREASTRATLVNPERLEISVSTSDGFVDLTYEYQHLFIVPFSPLDVMTMAQFRRVPDL